MRVSFSELPSEYPLIRFPKGLVQRKTIILSMSLRPVIECMKGKQTSIDHLPSMINCENCKNRRKLYNLRLRKMFSFVYYNHRSLQCLPHRNVRIAREWNALALSIGTRRDPAPACTIPFFSFIFTFSPFRAMPPGLN